MKVKVGWPLCYDPITRKMIPMFIKVRSKDIVCSDAADINNILQQTSMRWDLIEESVTLSYTHYRFKGDWKNSTDANAETVGCEYMNSIIDYDFYNDGRLIVKWVGMVSGESDISTVDESKKFSHREFYLPYAIPTGEIYNTLDAQLVGGNVADLFVGAILEDAYITNADLYHTAKDKYSYKINLDLQVPSTPTSEMILRSSYISGSSSSPLNDPDSIDVDVYNNYINKEIPLQFTYEGRWKEIGIVTLN